MMFGHLAMFGFGFLNTTIILELYVSNKFTEQQCFVARDVFLQIRSIKKRH